MATTLMFAPHFEEESAAQGATKDNIRAARRLMELVVQKDPRADTQEIEVTKGNPNFRPWERAKAEGYTIRVMYERTRDSQTGGETLTVHVVIPRWSETYGEVKALWKKHRTRLTSPPQTPNP